MPNEKVVSRETLKKVREKMDDKYVIEGEYSPSTSVGGADNLLSEMTLKDKVPYSFRTAGGALEIANQCKVKDIVGGTIVFNQLAKEFNSTNWESYDLTKGTVSFDTTNNECTYTVAEVGTGYPYGIVTRHSFGVKGHIYLVTVKVKASRDGIIIGGDLVNDAITFPVKTTTANYQTFAVIYKPDSQQAELNPLYLCVRGGVSTEIGDTITFKDCNVIDLTQMFGSTIADYIYSLDNATVGTGVAWVRKYLAKDYYPYNVGSFLNVKTSGKKVVGFNAYNNATGTAKLLGGNEYQITGTYTSVSYLDINGNSETLTIDANGKFTPVNNGILTVVGGNTTDTCVHFVWDGERDGEFEEYKSNTYPIQNIELLGIPKLDSNNNLYYDGDVYNSDGTIERRFGIVNLGTLTWSVSSPNFVSSIIEGIAIPPSTDTVANAMCSKYTVVSIAKSFVEYDVAVNEQGKLYVRDTSYSSAEDFRTAMSGVYLVYELATPITETATSFTELQQVDNWGTEEYLDDRTIPLPVGHNTDYLPDLKAKLEVAPESPDTDGYYVMKRENGQNSYSLLGSYLAENNYDKKLAQITDLLPTTQTLTLVANTRYALGTLTALNLTFPASGNDGDEIIVEFVSGSTATTLTLDNTNAIYNFSSIGVDKFVELNAQYKVSVGKWVVYSAETDYTAV